MPEVEHQPVQAPDPRLIQELFDMDPLNLKDQDIDLMIESFRAERMEYLQPPEEKKAKKAAAKKPAITAEQAAAAADLLDGLGL